MKPIRIAILIFAGLFLTGCGPSKNQQSAEAAPLTVESWKALPRDQKYEIETLERLRQSDSKYQNQREWDRFTKEVILPEKKRDGLPIR